ncbi:MAG: hypothetical protein Kow0058_18700 [Roseovarius sp.]
MKTSTSAIAFLAALTLSACATAPLEIEQASRNMPAALVTQAPGAAVATDAGARVAPPAGTAAQPLLQGLHVTAVRVSVPRTLKVSEANRFYPGGDIVWREDPPGDRYEQVRRIVEAGIMDGVRGLGDSGRPVMLDIEVTRFHALTEKARYTVGGVHAIQFLMQLRDAETGAPLGEPKFVKADFRALGGQAAIRAERQGLTQKVRITRHLAEVIRTELTDPEGFHAAHLGLIGMLNQF